MARPQEKPMIRPKVPAPDLRQQRGDRHLLVWAGAGAWIVADHEFVQLIRTLDGSRKPDQVARKLARKWRRDPRTVGQEVGEALRMLRSMGVVSPGTRQSPKRAIANVTVNLTNRCNLRCTHCYNAPRGDELEVGRLVTSLAEAQPLLDDVSSLIVLGGEPLLEVERLAALVEGTRDLFSLPTMVSTNGTRVDRETARLLRELQVDVQVSLDGPTAEVNDAVRGAGSYDRALQGVRALLDADVAVTLSMVYDRGNFGQMEDYADLALELGAREVRFIPLRLVGRAAARPDLAADQSRVLDHLLELLQRRPEIRGLLKRDFFTITRAVCHRAGQRTHCGIGRRVVFLDADGTVYPCPNHRVEAFRCGSVAERPLAEIFDESPVMRSVRRDFRVARYTGCGGCPVRPWCAGDCRGEVYAATGDVRGRAPHCEEMLDVVPRLMWLIAEGDPRFAAATTGADFL